VFLGISVVITPPAVSNPIDNGATSKSKSEFNSSDVFPPVKMAAYTAAP